METGMDLIRRKLALRRAFALLLALLLAAGMVPCTLAEAGRGVADVDLIMAQNAVEAFGIRDGEGNPVVPRKEPGIKGRGEPDDYGVEPDYRGIVGYVSLQTSWDVSQFNTFAQIPWEMPAYEKQGDEWTVTGMIQHKTPVLVLDQVLKEEKGHKFRGYLKVFRLDNQKVTWIDAKQFVTVPYWTLDLPEAVNYGFCIAVYRSRSRYEPMDRTRHRGTLPDGLRILMCARPTSRFFSPEKETNPLLGIVFRNMEAPAYYRTFLFFNPEDLILVY